MQERQELAKGLLTAEELSRLLDVDTSTIYRMAGSGRLPAVKVGRQWRFPAGRVDELVRLGVAARAHNPAVESTVALLPNVAQPVIDMAAELLGVMMVVTDMAGHPITQVANPCPWFTDRAGDPDVAAACIAEWRALADHLDFEARLQAGRLGFECARALVRRGSQLIGMVLIGGIAPEGTNDPALYQLDGVGREKALTALPKVAAALSRLATQTHPYDTSDARSGG
ncbi:MAG: helix-turn-helix domain-containing protein [Actinomycetota bacterium]